MGKYLLLVDVTGAARGDDIINSVTSFLSLDPPASEELADVLNLQIWAFIPHRGVQIPGNDA